MRIVTFPSRLYTLLRIRGLSLAILVDTTNPFMIGTWIPVLRSMLKALKLFPLCVVYHMIRSNGFLLQLRRVSVITPRVLDITRN